MAIFKKNYEQAAETDIERTLRRIEEKKKQTGITGIENDLISVKSNIDFAERIELLSAEQVIRLRQAVKEIEDREAQRKKSQEKAADFEKSSATGTGLYSYAEYKEMLAKEGRRKDSTGDGKEALSVERNCEERTR